MDKLRIDCIVKHLYSKKAIYGSDIKLIFSMFRIIKTVIFWGN